MRQDSFNVRQWLIWLNSRGSASKNYKNGVHVVLRVPPVDLGALRSADVLSWLCSRGPECVCGSRVPPVDLGCTIGADVLSWLCSRGSECICGPSAPPDQETHQGGVVDDSWQCSCGSESVRDSVFPSSLLVTTLVQISCQVGVEVCECF